MSGTAAAFYVAPALTAWGPVRRLGGLQLSGIGTANHVALTFDDGPDPASTPAFIKLLGDLEVEATFFLLGRMLTRAPWLGRELVDAGHEVALHGWDHRALVARGPRATRDDLGRGHDLITRICGAPPTFYRPPYGVMTRAASHAARELQMTPVLWTSWGRDWRRSATADSITADVMKRIGPGGTILLHDSDCTSTPDAWRDTLSALPEIVAQLRGRSVTPGPLRAHGLCGSRSS